jgi:hypothetical protein
VLAVPGRRQAKRRSVCSRLKLLRSKQLRGERNEKRKPPRSMEGEDCKNANQEREHSGASICDNLFS